MILLCILSYTSIHSATISLSWSICVGEGGESRGFLWFGMQLKTACGLLKALWETCSWIASQALISPIFSVFLTPAYPGNEEGHCYGLQVWFLFVWTLDTAIEIFVGHKVWAVGKVEMMHMQCCQIWRSETLKELVELRRSGLLQSGNIDILGQLVTVRGRETTKEN